jgi:hypothetical protein
MHDDFDETECTLQLHENLEMPKSLQRSQSSFTDPSNQASSKENRYTPSAQQSRSGSAGGSRRSAQQSCQASGKGSSFGCSSGQDRLYRSLGAFDPLPLARRNWSQSEASLSDAIQRQLRSGCRARSSSRIDMSKTSPDATIKSSVYMRLPAREVQREMDAHRKMQGIRFPKSDNSLRIGG